MNPIEKFTEWYQVQRDKTKLELPAACCMSTTGLDGFPNARFVSLKEVRGEKFIITGPLNSRKGQEIADSPKVAITFWWSETKRHVRIQGLAEKIDESLADQYFEQRNQASKIVSQISQQGAPTENLESLAIEYTKREKEIAGKQVERPVSWGGFAISPVRIELMEFRDTRFHLRELYSLVDGHWEMSLIQP